MSKEIYKIKLEEEKKVLITEMSKMGRVVEERTGEWEVVVPATTEEIISDENDKADRFEDYEEESARMNVLEERLGDVMDALKKFENNKFGLCEVCGGPIEEERLEANVSARTCIEHK